MEIFSNASTIGLGIVCDSKKLHGFWNNGEEMYRINYLEFQVVHFALLIYFKNIYNCKILIRCDNTFSYTNRTGGIH